MKEWFMVAIGGMLGTLLRHGINKFSIFTFGDGFPIGTVIANAMGCFCIGFGWNVAERNGWLGGEWEIAYRAGLLGGLTTFSAFSLEIVRFWQESQYVAGFSVLGCNFVLGIAGVLAGMALASSFFSAT